jgi:cyclophilin family peptidyl-prolyl cis-trans isomerase
MTLYEVLLAFTMNTKKTEILPFLLLAILALGLAPVSSACSSGNRDNYELTEKEEFETIARIETTKGEFAIRFFPEQAPNHAKNFVQLCGSGAYDGTYFHRVSPGFMIQGGDPNTRDDDTSNDGRGGHAYFGPGSVLKAEFNDLCHTAGTVSMARTSQPDSAGSQFFILLADAPSFDGKHTVFGQITEGIDVVARIAEEPGTPVDGLGGFNPTVHQYIEKCWLEEKEVEVSGTAGKEEFHSQEPTTSAADSPTASVQ